MVQLTRCIEHAVSVCIMLAKSSDAIMILEYVSGSEVIRVRCYSTRFESHRERV